MAALLLSMGLTVPARAALDSNVAPRLATAMRAAHFPEPLVQIAPTASAEDQALLQALQAYERRTEPDDFSALTAFLSQHPHSGWAPALSTNLGILYLHYGYFSRALDAWQEAWEEGKDATGRKARALVDGAVGDLARLEASLGHETQLAALFKEIGKRPISGSATEAVQSAAEELALSKKPGHGHLFNCGPLGLRSLMLALGAHSQAVNFLEWYHAGPRGTNLAEVARLADQAKLPHRLIFRKPGQKVPLPAIVHWKVGHFAAIVGKRNGRYHIEDATFPWQGLWVTGAALDSEASGYFLVPAAIPEAPGWRTVSLAEASKVWGKGQTSGNSPGAASPERDPQADGPGAAPNSGSTPPAPGQPPNCGMCGYNIGESTVSLTLSDTPVGYAPPIGPSATVTITYNQREDSQPQVFDFFNVSPKWTLNWLSYVTDDPNNPGASVSRYLEGGGAYYYTGYNSSTGQFAAQNNDGSILVLASRSPITYQRRLPDGSIEIYAQSDGATSYPRNIFLSKVIDPQGNTLTLTYDKEMRLVSLTDAVGRQTTFTYGLTSEPLLITGITDPFGRGATLTYNSSGRLSSITDVLGLTSRFTYDANSLVDAMTTPYGTTTFAYTAPGTSGPPRYLDITDPLGYHEREEWVEGTSNNGVPDSDPSTTVPSGMPLTPYNQYLSYRDSFHWDKDAYITAGCGSGPPPSGCNYADARDRHFNHDPSNIDLKSTSIESVKYPLENRIWYNYPGQTASYFAGTYEKPTAVGRVLDDGTTQLTQRSYDTSGYFKPTEIIDPTRRTTSFVYANHIDLSAIAQTTAYGVETTIAQFLYNYQHRPTSYADAAGQTTTYTYNAAGQLTSVTNPLKQTTTYQYDATGDLTAIIDANNVTAASFTYDSYDHVRTYTDSEGWTVTFDYDAANRITRITYPDGTTDRYTYDKLDLASHTDRLGRTWAYTHDADRRLTKIIDPLGHETLLGYNPDGELTSLTDPKGNTTKWAYDIEDRLTEKTYPDSSTVTYSYEDTTSRLHSVLDALGQTKDYSYTEDNRLSSITYLNAVNPTANVSFAYDPYFPRLVSMTDGTGTTSWSYVPVGTLGALDLAKEAGPLPNSTIAYGYDPLGRVTSRVVGKAGETLAYDAIGRLAQDTNPLGTFTISYLGETAQPTEREVNGGNPITWGYLNNTGDRRLASIDNDNQVQYQLTTMPENLVTGVTVTRATAYPATGTETASYNNLNQLTNLSGQALTYDADGNLLSDGTRDYTWDAENRLIGITFPAEPGEEVAFTYDGLGRRVEIASTQAGGGNATTTSYTWCGLRPCVASNSDGSVARRYYAEGEQVLSPATLLYYGQDQIGSTRDVLVAPADTTQTYDYDPYGNALQTPSSGPLTDFRFAGMFFEPNSGLYLTRTRVYDPSIARWLSRDPLGEASDPTGNLYRYVEGNPTGLVDPLGLVCFPSLANALQLLASNPWLIALALGTEAIGGGPEDLAADAVVAEEIAAAEATAEGTLAIGSDSASLLGQSLGKLGTVVENPELDITGFTNHGLNQVITRGVSPQDLLGTVNNPSIVLQQSGGQYLYLSNEAGVVLNPAGRVVTTYPSSMFGPNVTRVLGAIPP